MATLRFLLDKRTTNKDGKHPLRISIGHRKTNTTINLGVCLLIDQWQEEKQRSNAKYKDYKKLNNDLDILYGQYKKILDDLTETGKIDILSASDLRDRLVNSKNTHYAKIAFTSFLADFISRTRVKTDTYIYAQNTISKFTKGRTTLFEEINYSWLNKFEDFMIEGGLAVNSRFTIFKAMRSIFNKAIDEEAIGQELYPFRRFKLKTEQTAKRSMTVAELVTLRDYPCQEHQGRYRDMFMLIFYLIGINSIDLLNLREVKGGRVEYRRAKTGRLYSIKIEPEAQLIIDKYRGAGYLLNILDTYTDHKNFVHRLNKNLQCIGEVELVANNAKDPKKIKKNKKSITPLFPDLTTYWARHTWATIAASLDIPKETIAAALGHGGNEVTDIYIRFDERKIDEANRKVIDCLLEAKKNAENGDEN